LVHYLCGPMQRDQINMQAELAKYYLTASETPHALRMICDAEGNLPDINDWFPREEKILRRLRAVTVILGIPSMEPSDFDRAGNALRAMHPDFRAEFDENYKHSKLVPDGTVIPQGKWPVITWKRFKGLMLETQALVQRDLVRIARRAAVARKHRNDKTSSGNNSTNSSTNSTQGTQDRSKKIRCKRCRIEGHIAADCTQKPAAMCRGFEKGTCKYGRECAFGHTKAEETALVTTTAATESKRTPCDPKDQKSFECVGKLSDKCEGKFVLDMPFWNDKVAKDDWTLPDCCSTCRKFKKEQREQRHKSKQSSSMITEIEQDEYNDDSDRDSDHEYDGADDDYMLDYSISMSEASMIVEEEHYADYMRWQSERPTATVVASMTPLQRRAQKLLGAASGSSPRPFSDFYKQQRMQSPHDVCSLVVLDDSERETNTALKCEAYVFVDNQDRCILPTVVASAPSQPSHIRFVSDSDSDDDTSSDDDDDDSSDESAEGEPETPNQGDYHRHWLRCYMRDHDGYAPDMMHEAAALEEQHSAFSMQPLDKHRNAAVPAKYSHDGFVVLGNRIDFDMISNAEDCAGILNSSFEQSQNSIDCEMHHDEDEQTPSRLCDGPTPTADPGHDHAVRPHTVQTEITMFARNMSVVQIQATHGARRSNHTECFTPPHDMYEPPELSTNADGNHGCYCEHGVGFEGMCTHCMQCTGYGGCCGCREWPQYFR
jgi:hypothetical protein